MFFKNEEAKEIILKFSQGILKVLKIYFALIQYQNKIIQYSTLNVKLSNLVLKKWR